MAQVIDAFIATFGLDADGFVDGANRVKQAEHEVRVVIEQTDQLERRIDREREERKKKETKAIKALKREALGLFAVFTAGRGIKNFIGDTISSTANLGYLAANLKTTTEDLNAWQRASERAGGSADGITEQFRESAEAIAALKSGLGPNEAMQWFFRLGGSSSDLKDGNAYLLARAQIVQDLFKQDPAQAALMASNLGIVEDQFNFIKQGPSAILAMVDAQRKLSVISGEDAKKAQELRVQWLDLTQSLEKTTVKLLIALIPAFSKFIEQVEKGTSYLTNNKDVVAEWADKIVSFDWEGLAKDARSFAGSISEITKEVRELLARWDEWTGRSKVQTPGVTKTVGALRFGKREDLEKDNAATGRAPSSSTGRPKNETLAKISDGIEEAVARTLASWGNRAAGEYIRDKTGKDDYNVGPKQAAPSPAAPAPRANAPAPTTGARGLRNNNPGNIEYGAFARQQGASGSDGRFARFDSAQGGLNAMANLLRSYSRQGVNSIEAILKRYAPPGENDTGAYANSVSKATSFDKSARLDLNNPQVLQQLMAAMIKVENGSNPYSAEALRMAAGFDPKATLNQATQAAGMARAGTQAAKPSTTTNTTNIEKLEVHTKATDAAGIARDIAPALGKYTYANQANSGVRQ